MSRPLLIGLVLVIAVSLVPRFYRIGLPILDFHAWRQTDTAAIIRTIYRSGYDFLHPRVDWNGTGPDLVETEFQSYGLLVALCYGIFGINETVARLVSLFFCLATIPAMAYLARRIAGEAAIIPAVAFFLFSPLCIIMSRNVQPDMTQLFFYTSSVACMWHYLDSGQGRLGYAAALCLSLTLLTKVSGAHIGFAFLALCLAYRGKAFISHKDLWAIALVGVLPAAAWYSYAHSFPLSFNPWTLGPQHLSNWLGWYSYGYYVAFRAHFLVFTLTEIVGLLAAIGLASQCYDSYRRRALGQCEPAHWLIAGWTVGVIAYMALTSSHMMRHSYYCLPALPLSALLAAIPLARLWQKTAHWTAPRRYGLHLAIALAIAALWFPHAHASLKKLYSLDDQELRVHRLARRISTQTKREDLIITSVGHGLPELLYYADRRGWHLSYDGATRERIEQLAAKGATYYAYLQPGLPKGRTRDDDPRRLAHLVDYLERNAYDVNYCAGGGFGFTALVPLATWLPNSKRGTGLFSRDLFLTVAKTIRTGRGLDNLVNGLDLEAFVLPHRHPNEKDYGVTTSLFRSPRFKLVHFDDGGLVFLRADGRLRDRAYAEAYEYVDPSNRRGNYCQLPSPNEEALEHCLAESRIAMQRSAGNLLPLILHTFFCNELGLWKQGYDTLAAREHFDIDHRYAITNLMYFAMRGGRKDLAETWRKRAKERWPDDQLVQKFIDKTFGRR